MKITFEFESTAEFERFLPLVKMLQDAGIVLSSMSIQGDKANRLTKKRLLNLLENAPTLSEDELTTYRDARDYMNQWKIHPF